MRLGASFVGAKTYGPSIMTAAVLIAVAVEPADPFRNVVVFDTYGSTVGENFCGATVRQKRLVTLILVSASGASMRKELMLIYTDNLFSWRPVVRTSNASRLVGCSFFPGAKQDVDTREGGDKHGLDGSGVSDKAKMGGIMKEADGVLDELVRLREWQKHMENT